MSTAVKSVCPYCGVGCGIVIEVKDGRAVRVSGDRQHPANRGRLCTKGSTCTEVLGHAGRLPEASYREIRGAARRRLTQEEAIATTAQRLCEIRDNHGPDALSFYVSGQLSIEAQYLVTKLARGFIGTRHLESNSRLCMASAGSGYKLSLGADAPPGSYDDFDLTHLFFVIGSNMADCHPILFLRMMDRVRAGAKLVVVDPRRTATAEKADLFLQIRPGTDLALLNSVLHVLWREGALDDAFIAAHTRGWEAMPDFLSAYTPEWAADVTGLRVADIETLAQWIAAAPEWLSCWTMGLNQSIAGTWQTNAICNLHLATGKICRPGSGPFSLTGQPNAMGGREMGYMGLGLPGQRSLASAEDRAFVEQQWQVPDGTLRDMAELGTVAMFEAMRAGEIKACWVICTNPVATVPNRQQVVDALEATELVIAQEAFAETETNPYADMLLPAALWAEGEGVMVNSERNCTLMQRAVAPPGDALPDWEWIARIACAMGYAEAFHYESAAEVFAEICQFWNPRTGYDLRGISHERLREASMQWPCPPDASPRNPVRYRNNEGSQVLLASGDVTTASIHFPTADARAFFWPRPCLPSAEMPDEAFPFVLNTGRQQHQWHTATKTGKVAALNRLNPGPFVELHPDDAVLLGIVEGDAVAVCSRRGEAVLPALVTTRVLSGNCFVPFHWNDVFGERLAINAVTSDAVDALSLQPALKYAAVSLRRVEGKSSFSFAQASASAPAVVAGEGDGPLVHVVWASQTGTAEAVARQCVKVLVAQGYRVLSCSVDDCDQQRLSSMQDVLFVTSTFGDGEPPDVAVNWWSALQATESSLSPLRHAVLALGDSSYAHFCGFGRALDARLQQLGAQPLCERCDCEPDYRASLQSWLQQVLVSLAAKHGREVTEPVSVDFGEMSDLRYTRQQPLRAVMVLNRVLSGEAAQKEVRQVAFAVPDDFVYRAGDALGVWPENDMAWIMELLGWLDLSPSMSVSWQDEYFTLQDLLQRHLDIVSCTRDMLVQLLAYCGVEAASKLQSLLALEETDAVPVWLWGRQVVDVLRELCVRLTSEQLLAWLRPLQPRLYSISSSPRAHPGEVHITPSIVRYSWNGEARGGVCSKFLADRAAGQGARIFLQPAAHFHVPENPDAAVIMIGPGTGVAPFRGFMQERRISGAGGDNWLFFGEQHAASDFYYRDEWRAMLQEGVLTRMDCAFSRDQAEKIYVQHRLLEQGEKLWQWLDQGAYVYVCGDASRMAKDVDVALKQIVQRYGGMDEAAAAAYVAAMVKEKRYVRDVY